MSLQLQNHRMIEAGRDFGRSPGPTSQPKQGYLQPVAQDHVQMALEYLHRWRLHNLPGQAVPVLRHPHSKIGHSVLYFSESVVGSCSFLVQLGKFEGVCVVLGWSWLECVGDVGLQLNPVARTRQCLVGAWEPVGLGARCQKRSPRWCARRLAA